MRHNNFLIIWLRRLLHSYLSLLFKASEPRHDKTIKMSVRPAKTQISLGIRQVWSVYSLSAWRKLGSLATHWAHSEDSDQTGWMPRLNLSLRWAHTHNVGFVMSWLILLATLLKNRKTYAKGNASGVDETRLHIGCECVDTRDWNDTQNIAFALRNKLVSLARSKCRPTCYT